MKEKPSGFIAECQCGEVVGVLDIDRTDRAESSRLLGEWLADGCAVIPRFGGTWSVTVKTCKCNEQQAAWPQ